jgi:hypothetical protein
MKKKHAWGLVAVLALGLCYWFCGMWLIQNNEAREQQRIEKAVRESVDKALRP